MPMGGTALSQPSHASLRRPKVLVVDDQPANLVAMSAVLEDVDCECVTVTSGNEALRKLLTDQFAMMLLDLQMPGMNGYEVARLVRSNSQTRDVPIIFVTATHEAEEVAVDGYDSGAVDFLFKPISGQILRGKVRAFLKIHASKLALAAEVAAHQRTSAELASTNQALRHFSHAAAHDLRAPLRAAQGFTKKAHEDIGPGGTADVLHRSLRALGRMAKLLDSLLVHARLQKTVEWAKVDTADVMAQVESDLAAPIEASGAELRVDPLPKIYGDEGRIYQLFLNLISNAIKFGASGTPPLLHVGCKQVGDLQRFSIADNGIGIDARFVDKIFEPFARLHNQQTFEGSGLGLTICRQIVEQHGGRIWVEADKGQGSTFFFTLLDLQDGSRGSS